MAEEELFGDLQAIINASYDRIAPETTNAAVMPQVFPQSSSLPVMPSHMPPATNLNATNNTSTANRKPYIHIVEEPTNSVIRFRYKCEGRTAGSISGMKSNPETGKTFPTIEIVGYKGPVVVVVSCVTRDMPYRQHPHWLVSKDEKENCKFGVYRVRLPPEQRRLELQKVGIQCVKKTDVRNSLLQREQMNVDPFNAKFDHKDNIGSINLYELRLCYQAFITAGNSKDPVVPLDPVVSAPIFGKSNELTINRLCSCAAKVGGGDEIILLCDKVSKDDIQIRFFETNEAGVEVWEALADFQQTDIHKQTAIAFRAPRYKNTDVTHSVQVELQLVRPSDRATSGSLPFEYYPNPDLMTQQRRLEARQAVEKVKRKLLNSDVAHQSPKQYKMLTTPAAPLVNNYNGNSRSPSYVPEIKAENVLFDMDTRSCASASPYNNYNYPTSPSSCSTVDSIAPHQQGQQFLQMLKQQEIQQTSPLPQLQQQQESLNFTISINNNASNWNTTTTLFNGGSITPTNSNINFVQPNNAASPLGNDGSNAYNANLNAVHPALNSTTNFIQQNAAYQNLKQQFAIQQQPQPQPQLEQQTQQEPQSFSDLILSSALMDFTQSASGILDNIDTNDLIQNIQETLGNLDMEPVTNQTNKY